MLRFFFLENQRLPDLKRSNTKPMCLLPKTWERESAFFCRAKSWNFCMLSFKLPLLMLFSISKKKQSVDARVFNLKRVSLQQKQSVARKRSLQGTRLTNKEPFLCKKSWKWILRKDRKFVTLSRKNLGKTPFFLLELS